MARTAEKVRALVDEDPSFGPALRSLLDRDREVLTWGDVNDDLTSGQWGRLIEKDVLVDAGDGFCLAEPEAVREELDGTATGTTASTASTSESDDEDEGWTTWDKLAAVGSLALFAGYSIGQVRSVIGGAMDLLLGPIDAVLPFYAVIMVLATVTGLYSTILQANLMDMDQMGEYQERMKEIREREKAARERGDDEALEEIREEQLSAMGDQAGMFKAQFRPMVWIMLLTIPVFLWMYWMLLEGRVADAEMTMVFPLAGETSLNSGILVMPAWIVWYFLCSMSFTQVIRKSLNIQTTPT